MKAVTHAGPNTPAELVDLMMRIESAAAAGALITARVLRQAAGMPKEEFDALCLRAARAGLIDLHEHDFPWSIDDAQRGILVRVGDRYFVGMALRPRVR